MPKKQPSAKDIKDSLNLCSKLKWIFFMLIILFGFLEVSMVSFRKISSLLAVYSFAAYLPLSISSTMYLKLLRLIYCDLSEYMKYASAIRSATN